MSLGGGQSNVIARRHKRNENVHPSADMAHCEVPRETPERAFNNRPWNTIMFLPTFCLIIRTNVEVLVSYYIWFY